MGWGVTKLWSNRYEMHRDIFIRSCVVTSLLLHMRTRLCFPSFSEIWLLDGIQWGRCSVYSTTLWAPLARTIAWARPRKAGQGAWSRDHHDGDWEAAGLSASIFLPPPQQQQQQQHETRRRAPSAPSWPSSSRCLERNSRTASFEQTQIYACQWKLTRDSPSPSARAPLRACSQDRSIRVVPVLDVLLHSLCVIVCHFEMAYFII